MAQEADNVSGQFCAIRIHVVRLTAMTVSSHVHCDHLKVRRQGSNRPPVPAFQRLAKTMDKNNGRTLSRHLISDPHTIRIEETVMRALVYCRMATGQARPHHD